MAGTHLVKTENVPILTKVANWKIGFKSPLHCELIFIAGHAMAGRRWGSPQPILHTFEKLGSVPIRTFGNFNVAITDPKGWIQLKALAIRRLKLGCLGAIYKTIGNPQLAQMAFRKCVELESNLMMKEYFEEQAH
jgi:hypothetical protein